MCRAAVGCQQGARLLSSPDVSSFTSPGQPGVIKISPVLGQGSPTQWCEPRPCRDGHCSEAKERERIIIIIIKSPK